MTITKEEREDWRREAKETIELNADWEIRVTRLLDALKAAESHAAEMERQRDRLAIELAKTFTHPTAVKSDKGHNKSLAKDWIAWAAQPAPWGEGGTNMTGIELITAERKRQIEQEGFTEKHDTQHESGELSLAAMYYVMPDVFFVEPATKMVCWHDGKYTCVQRDSAYIVPDDIDRQLGWNLNRNKKTRKRQLEIAGALIAAEIDRLQAE